jgi:hypothetical protein
MARYKTWMHRVPALIDELKQDTGVPVTSSWLAHKLQVSQRRVMQLFGQVQSKQKIGSAAIFDPQALVEYITNQKSAEQAVEDARRRRVLKILDIQRPMLIVEAPAEIVNTELKDVPGVFLEPGKITITNFKDLEDACLKLQLLGYAILNDMVEFEQLISPQRAMKAATGGRS